MMYSREYEWELLQKLYENGVSAEDIVNSMLGYFSSDDTCAALESCCEDYDIPYDEED